MALASRAQLQFLRNLYEPAIGYLEANRWVEVLRVRGISGGEASKEISRLLDLKAKGQYREPLNYTKEKVAEEDDPKFNKWWK